MVSLCCWLWHEHSCCSHPVVSSAHSHTPHPFSEVNSGIVWIKPGSVAMMSPLVSYTLFIRHFAVFLLDPLLIYLAAFEKYTTNNDRKKNKTEICNYYTPINFETRWPTCILISSHPSHLPLQRIGSGFRPSLFVRVRKRCRMLHGPLPFCESVYIHPCCSNATRPFQSTFYFPNK